ncbi:hypothetical protein Efla_003606 [Eimeria flavescens]
MMEPVSFQTSPEAAEESEPLLQQQQQQEAAVVNFPVDDANAVAPDDAVPAQQQERPQRSSRQELAAAAVAADTATSAAAGAATAGAAAAAAATAAAAAAAAPAVVAATATVARPARTGGRRRRGWSWDSLTFAFVTSVLEGGPRGPPQALEELVAISGELPQLATPRSTQQVAEAIRANIAATAAAAAASSSSRGKERDLSVFRVLFRMVAPCAVPLGLLRLLEVLLSSLSPLLLEGIVASLESPVAPPSAAAAAAMAAPDTGLEVPAAAAASAQGNERSLVLWLLGGWALRPHSRLLLLSVLLAAATYLQVLVGVQCGFRMRKVALRAKNALLAAIFDAALSRPHALLPCYSSSSNSSSTEATADISNGCGVGGDPSTQGQASPPDAFSTNVEAAAAAAAASGTAAAAAAAAAAAVGLADSAGARGLPEACTRGDDPRSSMLARRASEISLPLLRSRGSIGTDGHRGRSSTEYSSSSSCSLRGGGAGALTRAVSFGGNLHRVVSQTLFDGAAAAVLSAAATAETAAAVAAEAVAAAAEHDAASSSGGDSYLSAVSEEEVDGENPSSSGFSTQWQLSAAANSSSSSSSVHLSSGHTQAAALRHPGDGPAAISAGNVSGGGSSSRSSSSSSRRRSRSWSGSSIAQPCAPAALLAAPNSNCPTGTCQDPAEGQQQQQQQQGQDEHQEGTQQHLEQHHQQQQEEQQEQQEQQRMRRIPTQRQLSRGPEDGQPAVKTPIHPPSEVEQSQSEAAGAALAAAEAVDAAAASAAVERDLSLQKRRCKSESQPIGPSKGGRCSSSSSKASASATAGALELVNVVSVDCERTHIGICVLHELWAAPLTLGLNLLLVYRQIPGAFLYAIAVTGLCLLAQLRLGQRLRQLTHRMMSCRDARLRACRELLLHVRETKLLGWEGFAFRKLWAVRLPELCYLRSRYYMHAIGNCLFVSTPLVVKVAALTCLVVRAGGDGIVRASSLFAALALIDKALQALNSFPRLMADLTAAAVALKRLGRCLAPPACELQRLHQQPPLTATQQAADKPWQAETVHAKPEEAKQQHAAAQNAAAAAVNTASVEWPVIDFRHAAFAWRPLRAQETVQHGDSGPAALDKPSLQALLSDSPQASSQGGTACSSNNSSSNVENNNSSLGLYQAPPNGDQHNEPPSNKKKATEAYALRSSSFVLHDAQLQIYPGELHVVVGRSGSGKSSLLSAVLGDMRLVQGEAYLNLPRPHAATDKEASSSSTVRGLASMSEAAVAQSAATEPTAASAASSATGASVSVVAERDDEDPWEFVAFAPQQPIIFEGTLRSNILMGRPLVAPAYKRVVEACALDADFAALGGDETAIDAGGHRLSGGQRARICLARAIYSAAAVSVCCAPPHAGAASHTADAEESTSLPHGSSSGCEANTPPPATATAAAESLRRLAKLGRFVALGKRALYLLDDPFSPLDAVTAVAVWRRVFAPGGVLSGRTVLLVAPHEAEIIAKQSSFISGFLLVEGGTARQYPSYEALQGRHEQDIRPEEALPRAALPANSFLDVCGEQSAQQGSSLNAGFVSADGKEHGKEESAMERSETAVSCALGSADSVAAADGAAASAEPLETMAEDKAAGKWKVEVPRAAAPEATRTGTVSWRVWRLYMRSSGLPAMLVLLLACAASTYCTTLCDYWLRRWTARGPPPLPKVYSWVSLHSASREAAHDLFYLLGYWGLALLSVAFSVVTTVAFVRCGVNASSVLQANLIAALLRAPACWYDSEPIGRLLNRLSDDVFAVDETLPQAMHTHILVFMAMVAKMTLLSCTVPALLLVMPIVAFVLLRTAARLRTAIRQAIRQPILISQSPLALKRLETVARSPLHCLLAGAVGGGSTLRAFRAEARYFQRCVAALVAYGNTSFLNTCLQAWLALRLQLIGATLQALLLAAVTLPLLFWPERLEQVRGEMAGLLALSLYAVSPLVRLLTQTITTFVRLEVQMVSVERIRDYLLVPPEESSYDAITGLPWQPTKPAVQNSSTLAWRWWRASLQRQEDTKLPLPLYATAEEQQPLLQQQQQQQQVLQKQPEWRCPDCLAPGELLQRGPVGGTPALLLTAPGGRRSAAAAAGLIAGHETLASLRPWSPYPSHSGKAAGEQQRLAITEGKEQTHSLPLPPAIPFGFHTRGRIDFENVTVAYSVGSLPALQGISLTVHPGEAVGIVGRTGAGKSTLMMALTRMVPYTGSIKLDGVDIKRIPIHVLRSRLAFVPQTPTLFSGTIRWNLDPAMQRTEAELFDALRLCRLDEVVRALPQALDTPIATVDEAASVEIRIRRSRKTHGGSRARLSPSSSLTHQESKAHQRQQATPRGRPPREASTDHTPASAAPHSTQERALVKGRSTPKALSGGSSSNSIRLSVGQKQLLCFCRALLRDAPVLCLDEANSAMDSSVEEEVLVPVIKSCLRRGSVLMISHRLQHLPSLCHRIGVVGEGRLLEYGAPRCLLRDPTSRFHALCAAAKEPSFPPASDSGPAA